ncbi:ATP-binding protein [Aquincola tertiaricarbonis]|uniref:ATP-binding protein n=1 Tax=Aquincola tertiaricarbonis TaxID=391953 RepID=UPI0009F9C1C2|nr:winged helix-turn-helix domain-containing protein [Aquincola tertiaricarbonis]
MEGVNLGAWDAAIAEGAQAASPRPAAAAAQTEVFRFDEFELHPAQRTLLQRGQLLRIGSRAFDLLVVLCSRAGEVVSNRELLAAAWPGRVVEEGSVRVHIANLRKALGDGVGERRLIANVPMRGYCFVAPLVCAVPPSPAAAAAPSVSAVPSVPPARALVAGAARERFAGRLPLLTGLVGRERESAQLVQALHQRRCVTLIGTGGIGKTSMALPVARQFAQAEQYEAVLVELAALSHADRVPMAIASALGVVMPDLDPLAAIAQHLQGDRRLLIVLDNCEHVIDGVATVAEQLLCRSSTVRLLATSREPLRIQGEWVQRLESLPAPPPALQGSLAEAMRFPAVQLFVERAAAAAGGIPIGDDEVPLVCSICRRLDGIPLAIELAAGAIEAVGLRGLVDRLGSRLGSRLVMIGRGRRTASPRHQTLRATLDWSHALLPPEEQDLLARLSVFRGVFSHAGAAAVFGQAPELLDACLAGLMSKSMVVGEHLGESMAYRLLETTREYAAERLARSDAQQEVALRHARHLLQQLQSGLPEDAVHLGVPGVAAADCCIDDLRQAVQWAFAGEGTRALGVALVAGSAPVWFSLSMLTEFRGLADTALAAIDGMAPGEADAQAEMRICEALGHALWHTRGGGEAMTAAFRRGLAIAERLQATAFRLRCRWGLWLVCNAEGDYAGSRRLAEQFGDIVAHDDDAAVRLTHERMMALGTHFQGDQPLAREFAQRVLQRAPARSRAVSRCQSQFAPRVAGLTVLARTLWLQGFAQQALARAEEAVQEALAIDDALSLSYAVAIGAAPVAFWCGDRRRAREWVGLLNEQAGVRSLRFWKAFGDGYQQLIALQDDARAPAPALASGLGLTVREALCTVDPRFLDAPLIARAEAGAAGWCTAELLRLAGEAQLRAQAGDAALALFGQALQVARAQQALAWELRCSTSLASLLMAQGQARQARDALQPVLDRFEEGHDTPDLLQAQALLRHDIV